MASEIFLQKRCLFSAFLTELNKVNFLATILRNLNIFII